MKLWNRHTIAGKLMRLNLQVTGTALVLAYLAFLAYDLYTLRKDMISSLATEAGIVGENCVTALVFDDQQAAEATLSALEHSPHIRWAVIERADGSVFARYTHTGQASPDLKTSLRPGQSMAYWTRGSNLLLGSRIVLQGRSLGAVYLLAETSELAHRAGQFGLLSALILVLCSIIAVVATSNFRLLVTRPLTELAGTAQVVSRERDYSIRAPLPRSRDELALLVQSFNEMLEQIQQRDHALEDSRNELEQRVRERTAELTEANKELEAFSYTVAHDLRGPLQHITNIAFMLEGGNPASLDAEAQALLGKLVEGTNGMSALIDDLLNLSRATSAPIRRTAIDLSVMAEAILDSLRADEPLRQSQLSVAMGAQAFADEGLMVVVLENLLRNAWKYTSKIEVAQIEFGYAENGEGTVYFVRDNGAGFNPRYADRLFRPFQRLHSPNEFPGTGIGLATALRIVARHGGRIWAEGRVDYGAAFYFTLPNDREA
jgi:signal transduction histidine kinase